MQKAGAVTAEILMEIGAEVHAGRTTREIDDIAREIFKKHKVGNSFYQYRGFPGQLCISINEEVVHGSGGPRRIQNGDIVSLDVGAIVDGWHGDNAMTVPVGMVDPEKLRQDASPLFQSIASQDQASTESSLAEAAISLKPWVGEFRLQHPQRGEIWLGGQASPERQADGSLIFNALLLDISARKQAQSELTRERQRLRSILEGANCGTWEWNVQTGECVFDARWLGLLGYAANELQPHNIQHWLELTHPEDLPKSQAILQKHLEGESSHYTSEFRMRHKDGHWVWIESRGRLLSRTSAG